MFKVLRKVLIGLLLLVVGALGYHFLSSAHNRRAIVQKAEEVREELQDDKLIRWRGTVVALEAVKGSQAVVDTEVAKKVTVNLAGIDAPEPPASRLKQGQPLAEESRAYLAQLITNRVAEMLILGTDSAMHPLVLLNVNGALINAKMVEAGLAEAVLDNPKAIPAKSRHAIENGELAARQSRLGIWGLTNYVRPVEFRIRHPETWR